MPRGHPLLDFMVPGLTDLMPTRHSVARFTRQDFTFHLSHHIILAYGGGHQNIQVMSISFRGKKKKDFNAMKAKSSLNLSPVSLPIHNWRF